MVTFIGPIITQTVADAQGGCFRACFLREKLGMNQAVIELRI